MSNNSNISKVTRPLNSPYSQILIVPGNHGNVLISLCNAIEKDNTYLWGIRKQSDFLLKLIKGVIEKGDKDKTLVLIYAAKLGVIALGTIDSILNQEVSKTIFWCDERHKNTILYPYRFTIKLSHVSRGVANALETICQDPCKENLHEYVSMNDILQRRDVEEHLKRSGIGKSKSILPTRNISVIKDQRALLIIEFIAKKVNEGLFVEVESVSKPKTTRLPMYRVDILTNTSVAEFAISLHLFSGKNVLLVGPPGSGKTSLLKNLLEKLGINYTIETGNPDWTPFDTIGGTDLHGRPRRGFISEMAEKCVKTIEQGKLSWLIIDEINRANVDLAFGKFFTLLDPIYRLKETLRVGSDEIWVPLSFRILATMNSYDRALLFKLGYALTRRFAVVNYTYLEKLEEHLDKYGKIDESLLSRLLEISREDCTNSVGLDCNMLLEELTQCSSRLPNDCVTPLDFVEYLKRLKGSSWREAVFTFEVPKIGVLRLDNIVMCLTSRLNTVLSGYEECEICPVQITPGILADTLKYVAVGTYFYKQNLAKSLATRKGVIDPVAYALFLLDLAYSSYVIPQLDILVDYVRREEFHHKLSEARTRSARDVLEEVARELESVGLHYSAGLVRRLERGYHVP